MSNKAFPTLVLLTLFVAFSCHTDNSKKDKFVFDKAGIFGTKEYIFLDSIARDYKSTNGSEIFIYVIPKFYDRKSDFHAFAIQLINDLKVGKPGLNNGALILVSIEDKKIELQLGYGFEWRVQQEDADSIVKEMGNTFERGTYFNGFLAGLRRIIDLTKSMSWSFCEKGVEDNCIRKIGINEILGDSTNALRVRSKEGREVIINYTKHMNHLIDKIKKKTGNVEIYCRPRSNEMKEVDLIGVL